MIVSFLHTTGLLARAAGWTAAPQSVVALGVAGGAVVLLVGVVVVVTLLRRKRRDHGLAAGSVEPGPVSGRVTVASPRGDEDDAVRARLVELIARGLGISVAPAPAWKPGKDLDEEERRARAQAARSGAGVVVWGEIEGSVLRLHLLAASAAGSVETYCAPVELPPPFDAGAVALVAAVGAEAGVAELFAQLEGVAEALTQSQAAPPSLEDAARLRAMLARVALARHALGGGPEQLAVVLGATAGADPRRLLEPLAWAESRAVRAIALDRSLAGRHDPPLAELQDRARAWREAVEIWSELRAEERVARSAEPYTLALLEAAERDGDVRALDDAEKRVEGAIARLGTNAQGREAARLAALLGALRLRLGEREPRPLRLEAAERELRRALVLAEAAGEPALAASIHDDLARSLARLGERDRGAERLRAAAVIYRLGIADTARDERSRARLRAALGRTLVHIGERDKDPAAVDEAVGALRMACNGFAAVGAEAQVVEARRALERAERLYAELKSARSRSPAGAG